MGELRSFVCFLVGGVGFILGGGGSVLGVDNLRVALQAAAQPRELRCADLAADGPGKNLHVKLTHFATRWDGCVVYPNPETGDWWSVCIPVAPPTSAGEPRPRDFVGVIVTHNVRNRDELDRFLRNARA